MPRRTAIWMVAALIGGWFFPEAFTSPARAADPAPRVNTDVASDPRDQRNEIQGVRELFAHAIDYMTAEDGMDQLGGLFTAETASGRTVEGGAAAGATPGQAAPASIVNSSDHARIVQRFANEWHAKYHADFQMTDPGVVFGDITPDDLRRSRRETGLQLTPPTTQPATAVIGTSPPAQAAAANRDLNHPATNPSDLRTVTGTRIPRTDPNSLKPLSEHLVVHLPGVGESVAFDVRLMRTGPSEFKFVAHGEPDPSLLRIEVDRHLSAVLVNQTKWPADVHQAQRLVAQHLLMAIADYESGTAAATAQPAAAHLPAGK